MYCEEEQGYALTTWLINEVVLVSAHVHVWWVQKQGIWLVFVWLWQRVQYRADVCLAKVKTDGGREALEKKRRHNRKFQVNAERKSKVESPQTQVFFSKVIVKD